MLLHGLLRRMQQQQTQAGFNGQSPSPPWWAGCLWCGSGLYNFNNQPTMHQSSQPRTWQAPKRRKVPPQLSNCLASALLV
jgi:hypothetical protein